MLAALVALALGGGLLKAAGPAFAAGPAVPLANNDTASVTEDFTVDVNVLANDTDADGDPLTISTFTQGANGTVTLASGRLRYDSNLNFNGTDSFTYRATDGMNESNVATVTVTVNPANDNPDAITDSKTTTEDTAFSFPASDLIANDTPGPPDEAGQTLSVTAVADIFGGTVSLNTTSATITFTPTANFSGPASFRYTVRDSGIPTRSDTGTVNLTVTPVNDAPVAVNDSYTVVEDTVLTVAASGVLTNDTDVDSTGLTASKVTDPASGTATLNANGSLSYTPQANFNGPVSFTYRASDASLTSNTATVTITVISVNDAPTAVNDNKTTSEDVPLTLPSSELLANDSPGPTNESTQTISVTAVSAAVSGTVSLAGGTVTFTPAADFNGIARFTYTVADNGTTNGAADPRFASADVVITVFRVNDPPTAAADSKTTNEDAAISFPDDDLLANDSAGPADESGQVLTLTAVGSPVGGTVSLAGGQISFTPDPNFFGAAGFSYTIVDDGTTSGGPDPKQATGTVTVNVTSISDGPPVAHDDAETTAEDITLNAAVPPATDPDGEPLMYALVTGIAGLTFNSDGTYSYVPVSNAHETVSFTYMANDGISDSNIATVTITVTPVNDAPIAVGDSAATAEEEAVHVAAAVLLENDTPGPADEASQGLTVTAVGSPVGGTVVLTAGIATFTPAANFNGTGSFSYTVRDDGTTNGGPDPQQTTGTVAVTVSEANDSPVAVTDAKTTPEDMQLSFPASDLLGNDSAGPNEAAQSLSVIAVESPAGGTVDLTAGMITFTPTADFNGAASFTYTIRDDGTTEGLADPEEATGTVNVTVSAANDAPTAVDDAKATAEDTPVSFPASDLVGNDSRGPANEAGQALTVTAVGSPVGGTVQLVAGTVTFTPDPDATGPAGFSYTATDNGTTDGAADPKSDAGQVTVTVSEVNDAPTAAADARSTPEDTALTFPAAGLVSNDAAGPPNEASQSLTVVAVGGAVNGTVALELGSVTFTPTADVNGAASFTYTIRDNGTTNGAPDAKEATGTVNVTISPVNDAPVAQGDSETTAEDTVLNASVPAAIEPDGDPVTYAVVTGLTGLTLNPNGSYTYSPPANFSGTVSFTYTASDGTLTSDAATVTITVTPVNDRPVATADTYETAEDTPLNVVAPGVLGNDNDIEDSPLTAAQEFGPGHGTLTLNANGSLSYTPEANFSGSDTFTYRASDGSLSSDVATVTVTVTPVNDAPSALDDAKSTAEDTVLDAAVPAASDADGDVLSYALVAGLPGLTFRANGTYTYAPPNNFSGVVSYSYKASDSALDSNVATVTITVTAVNDEPVAVGDAYAVAEDGSLTVDAPGLLVNDTDVDSAGLTASKVADPVNGAVTVNQDGSFTYTPAANFNGTDTFTYRASDVALDSNVATVTISVTEVNDAPVANEDSRGTAEDTPLSIAASGLVANDAKGPADEAGQALTVTSVQGAVNGEVSLVAGTITFTPAGDFNGAAGFTYTVRDNGTTAGGADPREATGTVNVSVSAVNDAPVAVDDAKETGEDSVLTFPASELVGNDSKGPADEAGQTLAVTGVGGAVDGSVGLAGGTITFTPSPDFNGSASFTYTVSDDGTSGGLADPRTDTGQVTVTVSEANDPPTAVADAKATPEDTGLSFPASELVGNDVEGPPNEAGQTLSVVGVGSPANGTVDLVDGTVTFTPASNFNGDASFGYTVRDDGTTEGLADPEEATGTVSVSVSAVNDAPAAQNDSKETPEDTTLNASVPGGTDIDGDTLTYQLVTGLTGLSFNANGSYSYAPASKFSGTVSFTYTVSDGLATSNVATVSITVTAVNDAPVAVGDAYVVAEDGSLTVGAPGLLVNDTDVDSASLSAVKISDPANGTAVLNADGALTYTPSSHFNGTDSFTYRASDGLLTSEVATVTLTVTEVNGLPVANDDSRTTAEDAALSFLAADLLANDSPGPNESAQTLSVLSVQGGVNGTVELSAGTVTFRPAANYNGPASFTYTIRDNGTTNGIADPKEATGTVNVTVTPVNDAPAAADDSGSAAEDGSVDVDVLGNDSDLESAVSVDSFSQGADGSVALVAGRLRYTPNADFNGSDSFTYTATDGARLSNVATVTVSVSEVNDAPIPVGDTRTATEDEPLAIAATTLSANDARGPANEAGQSLTVTAVGGAVNGTVSLSAGTVTFTPNADFNGDASFTYTVADNGTTNGAADAKSAVGTVAMTVGEVNDAPTTVADARAVAEEGTLSVVASTLATNDSPGPANEGAQSLTVTGVGGAVDGTVSIAGGTITFTPDPDFNGNASFTYTVADNGATGGAADSKVALGTVTVDVSPVNDAPTAAGDSKVTPEDSPLSFPAGDLLANDAAGPPNESGQSLSIISVAAATNGEVSLDAGTVTFTPPPDFNGSASFSYAIRDNGTTAGAADPLEATGTVTVTVTAVNDAPVAVGNSYSASEGSALTIEAPGVLSNDSDIDSAALTSVKVSEPANGTVTLNADGSFTYTPAVGFSGSDSFTYTASDGALASNVATVAIEVARVNIAPTAADDAYSVDEDATLTVPAPGVLGNDTDPNGTALTAALVGSPASGSVTLDANGSLTYTPNANFNGTDSFTYRASDGALQSNLATVTVTVAAVDDAPAAVNDSATVAEDGAVDVDVLANDSDVEGSALTIDSFSQGGNGSVSLVAGELRYTPNADFNGSDSFTYRASDGTLDSNLATVTITVTAVNDAPTAVADTKATAEDTPLTFPAADLTANDSTGPGNESGQTVTVAAVGGAVNGAVSIAGGTVSFTPTADFNGTASFTYTVTDNGTTAGDADPKPATGSVTVSVSEVNDPPTAGADLKATAEDTVLSFPAAQLLANDTAGPNESGQALGVISVGSASNGTVTLDAGTVTFTPAANFNGDASFTYTILDDGTSNGLPAAEEATGTVTVMISPVNDASVAVADSYSTDEEMPLTIAAPGVLSNDTDIDSGVLTAVKVSEPANGTATLNANGSLTYTPAPGFTGTDSFTYKASDGALESNVATVTIDVAPVSDAPVAGNDSYSVGEDGSLSVGVPGVLGNDTDVDSGALTAALVGSPANGSVTLNANGSFTYTPSANFNGTDSFTYRASDGALESNLATVTVTVSAVNDAPTAAADAKATEEDAALSFLADDLLENDSTGPADEGTQSLSVISVQDGVNGTVALDAGTVTFTPPANHSGPASFTYTIRDNGATGGIGDPREATGTVSVTVAPVNDAPTAADESAATSEDGPVDVDVLANDSDVEGSLLSVGSFLQGSNGSVELVAGQLRYTPNANFNGTDSFTYRASDGALQSNLATVTVTVAAVDDAPAAVNDSATVAEDGAVDVDVLANDSDVEGSALSIGSFSPGGNGSVSLVAGELRYTPNADFNGSDSFTYRASEGTLDSNLATVTITVTAVNDAPTAVADTKATAEDTPLTFPAADLTTNDSTGPGNEAGQTLTVAAVGGAVNGAVSIAGGTVSFTPTADFNGTASFTYTMADNGTTAGDADPKQATGAVTVGVSEVNDPPTAGADLKTTAEDTVLSFPAAQLLANDTAGPNESGQALGVISVGSASNGTVTLDAGTVTFTPAANFNGTASFSYTIRDNGTTNGLADAREATGTVTVAISAVNDAPEAHDGAATTPEDTPLSGSVPAGTDVDGDSVTYALVTGPAAMTLNANGTYTYAPAANFNGAASFTYKASDGVLDSNVATVTITVSEVNDAPVPAADEKATSEDTPLSFPASQLLANDNAGPANESGQSLSVISVGSPSNGTVTLDGSTVTLTPAANQNGSAGFSYTVRDNGTTNGAAEAKEASATVSVAVTAVNDAPVANDNAYTTAEETTLTIAAPGVLANDTDIDSAGLTAAKLTNPATGTVTLNADGSFTYTPAAGFTGSDSFTYAASDGVLGSSAATVTIEVGAVNDAPAASDDAYTVAEDGTLTISAPGLLGNDSDVDSATLIASKVGDPTNGAVTVSADGSFTYTPDANFHDSDSFTYRASDGALQSNLATVTITVAPVNDVPTAADDAATTAEDSAVDVDVLANDSDVEAGALSVASFSQGANGSVALVAGQLRYTPNENFNGSDSFTYRAADGALDSSLATVSVTVTPVNDAPGAGVDAKATGEDAALTFPASDLLANDSAGAVDEAGQTLNVTAVGDAAGGTVTLAAGNVTFTPAPHFNGGASFTYSVADNGTSGGVADPRQATGTVNVTVREVNDAPVPIADERTTSEDTPLTFPASQLLGNDSAGPANESGQSLSVVSVASPVNGTVALDTGTVTFTPSSNHNGDASFAYAVRDNGTSNGVADPKEAIATVTVAISAVNDAPVAVADSYSTAEETALTIEAPGVLANDSDVDSGSLTASKVGNPAHGTVTVNADGSFTYAPAAGFSGLDSFTYAASDGALGSAAATVTIDVGAINDAPVAANDAYGVAEDATLTIAVPGVLGNDSDVDSAALTAVLVNTAGNGSLSLNANGSFSYTPGANFHGSDSFTYRASDGAVTSAVATVTLTVAAVNDAPVAGDDDAAVAEDGAVDVDVHADDSDVDGDSLSVDSFSQGAHGSVALVAGQLRYTPSANFNGSDSFTYRASDGMIESNLATVAVTVGAVNDDPTAGADAKAIAEDAVLVFPAAELTGNDSAGPLNESSQTLTVTSVDGAVNGTVALAAGDITFTPARDFNGSAGFTYTVTDNGAADARSSVGSVTVNVTEVNDAPTAAADTKAATEDTPLAFPASDLVGNDSAGPANESGQSLSVISVGSAANGMVVLEAGTVTFTPSPNHNGTASFSYTVRDTGTTNGVLDAKEAAGTVTVDVGEVNDAPVAVADAKAADEDAVLSFPASDLAANDSRGAANESGQTLSVVSVHGAVNGTVTLLGATVAFTPSSNFNGPASFSYTIEDNGTTAGAADAKTTVGTVAVTVGEANDAPTATPDARATAEDTVLTFAASSLVSNDSSGPANESGEILTVVSVQDASHGTVSLTAGNITFTPAPDFNGSASFSYTVSDNGTSSGVADPRSATGTVTVTVGEVNDAPTAAADTKAATEDTPLSFPASELAANDAAGPPNEAGQTLTVVSVGSATNGSVSLDAGAVTFTPAADFNGSAGFAYTVRDNGTSAGAVDAKEAHGTVTVAVAAVNDAPVANANSYVTAEETPLTVAAPGVLGNDSDIDSATLSAIKVTDPANGSVTLDTNGSFAYTPASGFSGLDSFTYEASDGALRSDVATVTIDVGAVNDAPVALGDGYTVAEDGALMVSPAGVLANDSDPDSAGLTASEVAAPANGTLTLNATGSFTYEPDANFNGSDSFTYTASDGTLDSNVATVTISVSELNDSPTAVADTETTNEDTTRTFPALDLLANDSAGPADESGQALTVTAVGSPVGGTVSLDGGQISFTPSPDFNGAGGFAYTVTDNGTTEGVPDPRGAGGSVSVTVIAVNDPPTAVADAKTTAEDSVLTFPAGDLVSNDANGPSNESGQALTVVSVQGAANGTVELVGGTVTFTPAANYNGAASFGYTARDSGTTNGVADPEDATGTVNVTVTAVNDAPVAANDSKTTAEDTTLNASVPAASDVEADALSYVLVDGLPGLTLSPNGSYTYVPPADANGDVSFTYRANDGGANSNLAAVTITVTAVNDAPVAADDTAATAEDEPVDVDVLANDTDVDGDSLTLVSFSDGDHGSVTLVAGKLRYTPNAGYGGLDSFTYRASDGSANSSLATVAIDVGAVNDAPVAANQSVTTDEDTAKAITLAATDAESSSLTYDVVTDPTHGTLSGTAPNLTYTPAANYGGADSFTFRASDGALDSGLATVTITVDAVNDHPVAVNDTKATAEETALTGSVPPATDIEGDSLTYGVVDTTPGLVFNTNGSYTYTPPADVNGTRSFTYRASDGTATSNTATVTITINPVNDVPVAAGQNITTDEDTAKAITLAATDVDSDPLTYEVVADPANGELTGTAPNLTYTPNGNYNGPDSFTYRASDGTANSNVATVEITVSGVNDPPVADNDAETTAEDTALNASVPPAVDVEGSVLSYQLVAGLPGLTLNPSGSYAYVPPANSNGPVSFMYRANDGGANSNVATVTITVTPVNDAPVGADDAAATPENAAVDVDVLANDTDVEGTALTVESFTQGAHGSVVLIAGKLRYTPAASYNGDDSFTYRATDGSLDSNFATVEIDVGAVDDVPVADNQSVTTPEDTAKTIALVANDADSGSLSYTVVAGPSHGALSGTAPNLTYTPNANYNGPDSFTFKASDGASDSSIATVTIEITPVNDAPVAPNRNETTAEDTAIAIVLNATDVDSAALTYAVVAGPSHGALSGTAPNLTYTPAANYNGPDSFTYRANDGSVNSDLATVTITVSAVNDAPIALNDSFTVEHNGTLTVGAPGVLANDFDVESGLTAGALIHPANGTLTLNANGSFTYAPKAGFSGTDGFTYRANDGALDSNLATVTITVAQAPPPPPPPPPPSAVDEQAPTDPVVQSTSHTVGATSTDRTIDLTWSGATDNQSGVDGFSFHWDNQPASVPDTVKDAEETATGTTSPALSNGSWYFHLRTRDNAGNWTATRHLGPFVISVRTPQQARCVVPNLKGKTVAQARRLLAAGRCGIGRVTRAHSRLARAGRIVRQSRRPGARLPRGTKVSVVVSLGRRR